MIWAIVKNQKEKASPNRKGTCPFCKGTMLSKCGTIMVWHWAHQKKETCDSWNEPETYWHFHWKMTFGKENTEKIITKEGEKHIADIHTKRGVVIELQNSQIKNNTIRDRENFYGEKMIWLINGEDFMKNLISTKFWTDPRYQTYEDGPKKIVQIMLENRERKKRNEVFFKWKNPRKSWGDVVRPVFIDFGESTLFMVKEGMGTSYLRGVYYSKKTFIEKYGGNYDYYKDHFQNINRSNPLDEEST